MKMFVRFLKNWSLAVGMFIGGVIYTLFRFVPLLEPLKSHANILANDLMPVCVFLMLFFTFCKVNPKDLCLRHWFPILLLIQIGGCGLIVLLLSLFPHFPYPILAEGAMIAIICPTAAAAPIITGKLGGSEAAITSYVLLSNSITAICIPFFFPLLESSMGQSFLVQVFNILKEVFPLLILPLLLAWLFLWLTPKFHAWIVKWFHGAPFYIWAFNLVLLVGEALRNVFNNSYGPLIMVDLAFVGLILCIIQFAVGRKVGSLYGESICVGQALGQKNNVFAVWAACTYLSPITSLVPSSYILWQNIFNSWELSRKRKTKILLPMENMR